MHRSVKHTLLHKSLIVKSPQNLIELVTRPVHYQRAGSGHGGRKGCLGKVRSGDKQPRKRRLHQRCAIIEQVNMRSDKKKFFEAMTL